LKELWVDAVVTCGGRAAELVVYGEPLVSVGGDYPHAMARLQALLDFGIWGAPIVNERERGRAISYLFEKAIDTAKAIISSHSGEHWALVQALLKSEELEHEDIASVLGGRRKLEVEIPPKPSRGDEDEGKDR
jgi:ATP-dependent Zn protease